MAAQQVVRLSRLGLRQGPHGACSESIVSLMYAMPSPGSLTFDPIAGMMSQAPAMDHKGSQQAMDDTFSLVNISPQVGEGFNR